ncbi:MAG: cobalamin-binding protein [Bacteroidales bacterium]|nr:cobalamin-binding protein [Bacteroidales bacterium]
MKDRYPKRIVCMTEEPTETLYLLGEQDRIVGISTYTVRPARARKEKPVVSAFTSANIDKILDLNPDLVIGFSDIQAEIASELIKKGVEVHIFNHRTVEEIFNMIQQLGSLVGAGEKAAKFIGETEKNLETIRQKSSKLKRKPLVYFEEWYEPMITGIDWVTELIEIAGGIDCFPEHKNKPLAKNRIVANPEEVIQRNPDIILGSWCGRKFRSDRVIKRAGWHQINAVNNKDLFEIDSAIILQPGPAALTDGVKALQQIIHSWSERNLNP